MKREMLPSPMPMAMLWRFLKVPTLLTACIPCVFRLCCFPLGLRFMVDFGVQDARTKISWLLYINRMV